MSDLGPTILDSAADWLESRHGPSPLGGYHDCPYCTATDVPISYYLLTDREARARRHDAGCEMGTLPRGFRVKT